MFAKLVEDGFLREPTKEYFEFSFSPFTALGVAVSLFLGFHNNASYGRWWEARTLWGTHVINMRNLTRFLLHGVGGNVVSDQSATDNDEEGCPQENDWRVQIVLLAMAQTHAMRHQLRPKCRSDGDISALHDRNRLLTPDQRQLIEKDVNPAESILSLAACIAGKAHREGLIDSYSNIHIAKLIDDLCVTQTACERIHNTSLPLAYSLLVHRTAFLYVVLAPFAIVESMGWWTPLFTAILAYTFFGLDELSRQIQEPFRDEPACLALSAMCRTMERDVCQALGGARSIPESLTPVRSVLM